ncbi:calcium-activated chloride channel regulator 4A [Eurytemora carolleeae]|uniref:calcium-activated chloride channel regulator 4A n=1 Tax=Eurytemora carolleeae TaxID=1294199 RepID=UPI000C78DC57|nr:calcium-activated chloride channel regulator 4A [Eurytemora carolleeae]|eukprot:XP_023344491.1 calcium-activated chloride channel regulator 4A-like [Eurytemora affinis]
MILLFYLVTGIRLLSALEVEDDGYALSVDLRHVENPVNCQQYLDKLEGLFDSASLQLHSTTAGRKRFKKIQMLVPSTWSISSCQPGRQIVAGQVNPTTDVEITKPLPGIGNRPWSLNINGCGEQGLKLLIPESLIFSSISDNEKGLLLMNEWIKFRFGVFNERQGFKNDSIYRDEYFRLTSMIKTEGCVSGNTVQQQYCVYGSCTPTSSTSLSGIIIIINCAERENLEILAPTKQNLVCGGKSARSIISNHPDLKQGQHKETGYEAVRYEYVLPQTSVYTLVLDLSSGMQENWESIHKAILRFILTIPSGTRLSIITFSSLSTTRTLLPQTLVTDINRETLFVRIPRRSGTGPSGS